MNKITCAVFGFGKMGYIHVNALTKMENVLKVIVIEIDPIKRDSAVQMHRKVVAYANLSDCFNAERSIDYITISTPSRFHFVHVMECMNHHLNILVEKPFVTEREHGLSLIDKSLDYTQLIGVGFIERYNSAIRKARSIIKQGAIGNPIEIHTRRWSLLPSSPDVGVVLDLASHDIDICRFLIDQEYSDVFARAIGGQNGLETSAIISGRTTEGILINNSVSWGSTSKLREIFVIGARGTLKIDTSISELTINRTSKPIVGFEGLKYILGENATVSSTIDHEKVEPIITEHSIFQNALNNNNKVDIITLLEAQKSLNVIDCVYLSLINNEIVKIDNS